MPENQTMSPGESPEALRARLRGLGEAEILRQLGAETDEAERSGANLSPERVAVYYEVLDETAPLAPAPVNFTASWARFQREHPEAFPGTPKPARRQNRRALRILIAAAAAALLCVTASAENLPGAIFTWGWDTLKVQPVSGNMAFNPAESREYHSLQEALSAYGLRVSLPTWIPSEYSLQDLEVTAETHIIYFSAAYLPDNSTSRPLFIYVWSYSAENIPTISFERDAEVKTRSLLINGYPAVTFTNVGRYALTWNQPDCTVSITGIPTEEDLNRIIRSIPKED